MTWWIVMPHATPAFSFSRRFGWFGLGLFAALVFGAAGSGAATGSFLTSTRQRCNFSSWDPGPSLVKMLTVHNARWLSSTIESLKLYTNVEILHSLSNSLIFNVNCSLMVIIGQPSINTREVCTHLHKYFTYSTQKCTYWGNVWHTLGNTTHALIIEQNSNSALATKLLGTKTGTASHDSVLSSPGTQLKSIA